MTVLALIEVMELLVEPMLGLEGDGDDVGRLSLPSSVEDEFSTGVMAVVPGGLNEQATDVDVAGLGDGSTVFFVTGGVLRGNEAEVGHERSRREEAADVVDLTQECQGSQDLHPAQATEGLRGRAISI